MTDNRLKILIADDSEINREIFVEMLGDKYAILEAENGVRAVELLREHSAQIALILLDIVMPEMDGYGVLREMGKMDLIGVIPVLVISSSTEHEAIHRAYDLGATDYLMRNSDATIMRRRISNSIALLARQKNTMQEIERRAEQMALQMRRMECEDELTGCNNLREFLRVAVELLKNNKELSYALCYCDLRQFRLLNEQYGYAAGDALLKYWANIIREDLQDDRETFGRVSADCFAMLIHYEDPQEPEVRFWKRLAKLNSFSGMLGRQYSVEVTSGMYLLRKNDAELLAANQMLDRANMARRSVKNLESSHFAVYDEAMMARQVRNSEISRHLTEAIANREISVWFQPQTDYTTGRVVGAEALCRWTHPTLGWISPAEFIPILEETGKIYELDRFVWEETCRYLRRWSGMRHDITLSVNISRADICGNALPEVMNGLVMQYGLDPKRLHLEVTESVYMDDPRRAMEIIARLQSSGFAVEMDDFGSGFSSLNMLKALPVDVLKLDAQFLRESWEDDRSRSIIRSIVRMADDLSLPVICEGVETVEQAEFLKEVGCRLMQGYYFAKPMPAQAFESYLEQRSDTDCHP